MSYGLPDWKLALNIIGQDDGYLKQRPSYGAASLASGAVVAGSMVLTTLTTVAGSGVIYGGRIFVINNATHVDDKPIITVDGYAMGGVTWEQFPIYGYDKIYSHPFTLVNYDIINGRFGVSLLPGITFEDSISLGYVNVELDEPDVYFFLVYALV